MCGITVYVRKNGEQKFQKQSRIQYRGPDSHRMDTGVLHDGYHYCMIFDRLSIVGVEKGFQPIRFRKNKLVCNGEIYNYKELPHVQNRSDCYSIKQTFMSFIEKRYAPIEAFRLTVKQLDGVFAIVMVYEHYMFVARDPIGVRPLFYTTQDIGILNHNNVFEFCSEQKGTTRGIPFPPGHWGYIRFDIPNPTLNLAQYTTPLNQLIPVRSSLEKIRGMLIESVKKRLMSERPIMYLLSGGLDSSIIAAIGASLSETPINTCSIGVEGSPDLIAAKKMAEHIGSNHHTIKMNSDVDEDTLDLLIDHLETYDTTTIRASMPMFMLSKFISEKTDCKVILSGEGADELFGGYLYFHYAPTPDAFQKESIRLIENLYQTDVLRSDRSTAAHGLEIRVPFLDREFVKYIVSIIPEDKMPINGKPEKFILREAFKDMLPEEIYSRQKEAFSDGVGTTWVTNLKKFADEYVKIHNVDSIRKLRHNTPLTNEEVMYRHMYHELYNSEYNINEIWRPKWTDITDPSATQLDVHQKK